MRSVVINGGDHEASRIHRPPRTERRVAVEWVEGVARLDYYRPPCAERAAALGWNAMALFGCRRKHPFLYLGSAGLLWALDDGRHVELHRDRQLSTGH